MAERATILVVDDDESLISMLHDVLSENYQVFTAVDVLEATDLVITQHLDLILADLHLPILSGVDWIRKIRASPQFDTIPILCISGFPQLMRELQGVKVEGFVAKPFALDELDLKIRGILARYHK